MCIRVGAFIKINMIFVSPYFFTTSDFLARTKRRTGQNSPMPPLS